MPKYQISAPFWDGAKFHPKGSICEFAKGEEPPLSKPVEEEKPAVKAAK